MTRALTSRLEKLESKRGTSPGRVFRIIANDDDEEAEGISKLPRSGIAKPDDRFIVRRIVTPGAQESCP
jgi:hypothetical protein